MSTDNLFWLTTTTTTRAPAAVCQAAPHITASLVVKHYLHIFSLCSSSPSALLFLSEDGNYRTYGHQSHWSIGQLWADYRKGPESERERLRSQVLVAAVVLLLLLLMMMMMQRAHLHAGACFVMNSVTDTFHALPFPLMSAIRRQRRWRRRQ